MDLTTTDFSGLPAFFATLSLSKILPALLILVVGYFVIAFATKIFDAAIARTRIPKTFHTVFHTVFRFVMWMIILLMAANSLGFNTSSLVALLSVATLALSLSLQGIMSNVAGGVTVLSTQPFQVGEYVEIGGVAGNVVEVGIVYTKLATLDNKIVLVPNSEVSGSKIINYTSAGTRRVDLQFFASYDADVETVKAALLNACLVPVAMTEPAPFVAVNHYGDHAICYDVRVWVKAEDYWDAYYGITANVKTIFDQTHIAMTYPHLNVHLDSKN